MASLSEIEYEKPIRDCMEQSTGPYQIYSSFFADKDLQDIEKFRENTERVEKYSGIVNYKFPKGGDLEKYLRKKLEPIIGPFLRHGGSYVDTPEPFNAHCDTGKADEMKGEFFPYKNILIPLTNSQDHAPLVTILFKQRHFGQAAHLWRGKEFEGKDPIYNFKMVDYSQLKNFTGEEFDQQDFQKWLSHLPKDSLFGLSIESIIEWKVGDLIIFDCSQVHASNNFKLNNVIKKSLTLFTSKRID